MLWNRRVTPKEWQQHPVEPPLPIEHERDVRGGVMIDRGRDCISIVLMDSMFNGTIDFHSASTIDKFIEDLIAAKFAMWPERWPEKANTKQAT